MHTCPALEKINLKKALKDREVVDSQKLKCSLKTIPPCPHPPCLGDLDSFNVIKSFAKLNWSL